MKKNPSAIKCIFFVLFFGILVMVVHASTIPSPLPPQVQAAGVRDKHIISVMVEREDTLWELASQYYTPECGSMKEYVAEIKQCNSLENDTIYAGYDIVIPVWYSEEEAAAFPK